MLEVPTQSNKLYLQSVATQYSQVGISNLQPTDGDFERKRKELNLNDLSQVSVDGFHFLVSINGDQLLAIAVKIN